KRAETLLRSSPFLAKASKLAPLRGLSKNNGHYPPPSRASVEGSRHEGFKVTHRDPSTALGMATLKVRAHLLQHVQRRSFCRWRCRRSIPNNLSILHHKRNAFRCGDVLPRIAGHGDDIGELSFLECAEFL